jgi:hypothetical protein
MCAKEDKCIGIPWIGQKIDPIDDAREKKDAIIEQPKIYWQSKSIGNAEGHSDKSSIKEYTGTNIERLFECVAF